MLSDLRFALRSFTKSPGFTLVAVLTLAVGIGASTAIFSALRVLVVQPFDYPNQDRIVQVWPKEDSAMGPEDFLDIKDQASSFSELGAYTPNQANIGGENPQAVRGAFCTSGVLRTYGILPALGRWLDPADEEKGAPHVAVISNALWRRAFGADPGLVGRMVSIDGTRTTVVGIMPAGFEFAGPWYRNNTCEIWTPLTLKRDQSERGNHWLSCVGRLKQGVTVESADAEIKTIGARLAAAYPDTNANQHFFVRPLRIEMTRYVGPQVWMLFSAVVLVLLVACANVASMLLARNAMRQNEFGIRIALGAARSQIIRLILTESIMLALAGSVMGILFATYGIQALALIAQTTETRRAAMTLDGGALAFAVCATVLTALLAGVPPALAAFHLSVTDVSRGENRSVAGSRTRQNMMRGLVISQVAVAFVLANTAALFSASYLKVLSANRDLASTFVLSSEVDLHGPRYDKIEDRTRFAGQLAERAATLPAVAASGITSKLPLEGGSNTSILVNNEVFDPKVDSTMAEISSITPGYFAAAGIKIVRGRTLEAGDAGQDNIGVVVNRALADKCWPGQDPLGKLIRSNSPKPFYHARVVGVVENVRQWGPKEAPNPEIYWTIDRAWGQTLFLVVRSAQPAMTLAPLLKVELAAMDRDLPMSRIRTLKDLVRDGSQGDRATAEIVDFFMATALGLVAVGLYGTLSYYVLQRTREIGIRMAVGAERGSVLRLIFRQGLAWVAIGVGAGGACSVAFASALRSMIWGVDPISAFALLGSAAVVGLAATIACLLPALRAASVDPMTALRIE